MPSLFDRLAAVGGATIDGLMATPLGWLSDGQEPEPIVGVFDEAYQELDPAGVPIGVVSPMLFLRRGQLPEFAREGDGVLIDGRQWTAASIKPDGLGGHMVHLHIGNSDLGRWRE
ncbi:MAG: head-tail joining protein [Pseudomonadota bacterium]